MRIGPFHALLICLFVMAIAIAGSAKAQEDTCTMISASNTGPSETRIIDGFEYTAESWSRTALLTCARQTVYDSCAPLEAEANCQKTGTECVE